MADNDTFVKVTNRMIYDKICTIEKHVEKTNGKVKLNRWIASTALGFVLSIALFLMKTRI